MSLLSGKVAQNASWIIGCRIVQAVAAFILSLMTARYLGPSNYGLISYATSLVTFVTPLMQLGQPNILVQEIVNTPEEEGRIMGSSVVMCLLSSFCCVAGIAAFSMIASGNEPETLIVCALYSLTLVTQAAETMIYWFQAKYLSKYSAVIGFIAYLIVAVYRIILLITNQNVYWFAVTKSFDYLLISIGLCIMYRRLGGARLSFSLQTCKRLFANGKYYILSNLMVVVFAQTDRIMIKFMLGDAETGMYSAAVSSAGILSFVFVAVIDSMRPHILEGKKIDDKSFEDRLTLLFSLVIYAALAFSAVMTIFAKPAILVQYGEAYAAAVPTLRVVVWYTAFSYFGGAKDIWILAEGKQGMLFFINTAGAVTNVVLNIFLIKLWGCVGAAAASLITQVLTNTVMLVVIPPMRPCFRLFIRSLNPFATIKRIKSAR